jgi:beta-lactamase superfamily II metal-dependent hydrolase
MAAEFYLFDVDHGQSAALRLPNGRWCLFDAGSTQAFSPSGWIVTRETSRSSSTILGQLLAASSFKFLKATVSHLHGDHLADWLNLVKHGPEFIRTVQPDQLHLTDCRDSNTESSWPVVLGFTQHVNASFSGRVVPDYGGAVIREMSLPVWVARTVGGDANARINNASIVTRLDVHGNSILLCGDMMKEAWESIIADQGQLGAAWRPFLSNVDVLVAPHHGHRTGYTVDLLNLAKPAVVLVSAVTKDPNVDSRYSQPPVRGIRIDGTDYGYISTRQKGHIKVSIASPQTLLGKGTRSWSFGPDAL